MPFLVTTAVVVLLFIAVACITRLRSCHRHAHRKSRFGFYPVAAGNALQVLQAIVQPSAQHTIELRSDDQTDEDDASDPNDPIQHLHRQAAKIRRGEPIDRLTALLPCQPPESAPPSEVRSC